MKPRQYLAAMALVAVSAVTSVGIAGTQDARPETKIRLAHLSPDTEPMDVYVTGADDVETLVLSSLAFSEVSEYVRVPIGFYRFGMRPAGSPVSDPTVISTSALLEGADAYTFAALGPKAAVQTELFIDELRVPASGKAAVRMIQAAPALGQVDVRVVDGAGLYSGLEFGAVGSYTDIPAGTQKVRVIPRDTTVPTVESMVTVEPGSVVTLIVGGKNQTTLAVTTVVDATGLDLAGNGAATPLIMPAGGIATGGGGTAPGPGSFPVAVLAGGVLVVGLLTTGLLTTGLLTRGTALAVRTRRVRV